VDPDPIPPLLAQTVAHAIDSSTLLLVAALTADSSGTAQHHLVAVMHSLLALELALKSHSDILKSCFSSPRGTVTAAFLISSSNRVRKNSSGGVDSRSHSVSANLTVMATAVDAGIIRLIKSYRDIIDAYVFPKIYADALKVKIAAHF
jgi:hypothetical protein